METLLEKLESIEWMIKQVDSRILWLEKFSERPFCFSNDHKIEWQRKIKQRLLRMKFRVLERLQLELEKEKCAVSEMERQNLITA